MKFNTTNILLIVVGLILTALGLFRECPLKITRGFLWNFLPMFAMLAIAIATAIAFNQVPVSTPEGKPIAGTALERGFSESMRMGSSFWFTVVMLIPLIGFSTAVTPVFQSQIEKYFSGWIGWVLAIPVSFTSPGGSGYSGVVKYMWQMSRHYEPMLLYFLTIVPLTAYTIFQIRVLGLGPDIARRMYIMNWASVIWLMPMFLIYKFFIFKC